MTMPQHFSHTHTLLLLLIAWASACGEATMMERSVLSTTAPHSPQSLQSPHSPLPPPDEGSYVLLLQPASPSAPHDTFHLKTCLHAHGFIVEQSCTPTFTTQNHTPVPITSAVAAAATGTMIPPLNATELSQITHLQQQHQAYHLAIHRASALQLNNETIVISGSGAGAGLGAMIQHNWQQGPLTGHQISRGQLDELTAELTRLTTELEPYLVSSAYTEPLQSLRKLIDHAAKRTVFMPELIAYLDQQGLPAQLRQWLHRHHFSVAHYLLHATKFENLLTPEQYTEYIRLGGVDEFSHQISRGMQRWLELKYQLVDARLLFRPHPRRMVASSLLGRYQYYYEAPRTWDPRRQTYVPAQLQRRAVRTQILNFMMGLKQPAQQPQPWRLGQLKPIPGSGLVRSSRAVARHGLTEVSPLFYQHNNKLYRAHETLSDYLRLQELTTWFNHNPRPLTGVSNLATELPWPQRLMKFMVKHSKGSALGAAIGSAAAAIIIYFQPAADPPDSSMNSPRPAASKTTLIRSGWQPDEHHTRPATPAAMHALIAELIWQHKQTQPIAEQGGTTITQYCLPNPAAADDPQLYAKVCYPV